ncbi:MAG: nucleoside triphosphate pyrophosphatase [Methylococcales bacterium]
MTLNNKPQIILASQSPRRRELLNQIGITFIIRSVEVDEHPLQGEAAKDYVARVAAEKSLAAFNRYDTELDLPVLAADTSVVLDGEIFGKPADKDDAFRMLMKLSGQCHEVISAVSLRGKRHWETLSVSSVRFRRLHQQEVSAYWRTGEQQDKAGAYAIQGKGALFVSRIEGSYSGIVGLPLNETADLLKDAGIQLWEGISES